MKHQTVSEYLREIKVFQRKSEVGKMTYKEVFLKYLRMYQSKEKEIKNSSSPEQYARLKKDMARITNLVMASAIEAEKAGEF